jgi:hypothetical protein
MHLLGGIVARTPAPSPLDPQVLLGYPPVVGPPWAKVLVRMRLVGVDMAVFAPVQQKTRLPHPGSIWRFSLTFYVLCYVLVLVCALRVL